VKRGIRYVNDNDTTLENQKRKQEVLTFSSGDTKMRCVVVMYRVPATEKNIQPVFLLLY